MTIRQFSGAQLRRHLPIADAIAAVRHAFLALAAGEFETPLRTSLGDGSFLIMSAHHRPSASVAVKSLTIDFDRRPAIQGVVTWAATTGSDVIVADAAVVTALRTGAVVAVATERLSRLDASHLVLIGLGELARDQLSAAETALVELGPALASQLDHGLRTVFKSVGLAIQDWAIVGALATRADEALTPSESLT